MCLLNAAQFSNRGIKLENSFSTLIFERCLDFVRAGAENPADSPIISFTTIMSTAAGRMSSSAIVYGAPYISGFYVLPCKMLANHCLVLMPAYKSRLLDLLLIYT